MIVAYGSGMVATTRKTRHAPTKGYARSRQAYDARRRAVKRDRATLDYMTVLRGDPCAICGGRSTTERQAVDHIEPLEAGGRDEWQNMTALCRPCNASKSNHDLLRWLHGR